VNDLKEEKKKIDSLSKSEINLKKG